ncbi:YhcH/YjgK/YiaL family protein [Fundicoccus sp. Sow4_H7]|uniref:YhcH/YjgK/YiaL family protein n=1 Tax=Fundicoccus sp. Sow4_H7 TaxID=3438784 RepID=UPI003F8FD344
MILDHIEHLKQYPDIYKKIDGVLQTVLTQQNYEVGQQYPFDNGFYFFVEGETLAADFGEYEAHQKYLDIQILLEGNELLYWSPIEALTETVAYDENKDITFFTGPSDHPFSITAGTAYVLFPWDGHKAGRHIVTPMTYKKAVIKIAID